MLKRITRFIEQVAAGLVAAGVLAAGAVIAVLGGRRLTVEGWEVILLVVLLLGLTLGEIVLFRRSQSMHKPVVADDMDPPLHRHENLLIRICALEDDLDSGPDYVSWQVAQLYNDLRHAAITNCAERVSFDGLDDVKQGPTEYAMIDRSSLRALVRQLRALVESDK